LYIYCNILTNFAGEADAISRKWPSNHKQKTDSELRITSENVRIQSAMVR